jgi:nitroreductase
MMQKLIWKVRSLFAPMRWQLFDLLSARPRLSAFYYAVMDGSLSREGSGVLAGRVRFRRDLASDQSSYFLLRRNIHRLEKGLIMRPRKPVFARDYLRETIDVYARLVRSADGQWSSERRWARDVLRVYFESVDPHEPVIRAARALFDALEDEDAGPTDHSAPQIPFARDLSGDPPVGFDSFHKLSTQRRSVRWYRDEPVDRALLDRAFEVANQAPSACNRQPFVYRVIDDPARARRIAAIPLGTQGFSDKLPAVIVLVGRLRAYPEPRDRHAIYIDGALSAMALMYALETLGLASCPINWPDIEPQERMMAAELGLERDERVVMLIAYGWPDPTGLVPRSSKKDLDEIRVYA